MVVTVTVTKIYGKMNFNRWALAITEGVDRGVPHSQFPPPFPPLPSPVSPTSLPLLPHFPPPIRFSLPLIKCCSYLRIKVYVYVSEELRLVHHRLSCRIFMQNYQVGKDPDYLQISVFSRTSKGNIIYTRQNKKKLLFMVTFGTNFNFEPRLYSRLFKGFLFYFFHTKSFI